MSDTVTLPEIEAEVVEALPARELMCGCGCGGNNTNQIGLVNIDDSVFIVAL